MALGLSTSRIVTYVFLFLVKLRFSAQDSIIKILQRHYGDVKFDIGISIL